MGKNNTIKITENQMIDTLGIIPINLSSFTQTLYKYMPVHRLMDMLREKEMAFVSPNLWNDPYETKYLETDYSAFNYKQPPIFACCLRNTNENEEASWKIYSDGQPIVRVSFRVLNFCQDLHSYCATNRCNPYWSKVEYSLTRREINGLCNPSDENYQRFFSNFCEESYIRLMSLKRKAFSYENEHRFFIVPTKDSPSTLLKDKMIKIPISIDCITRVTLCPMDRLTDNTINSLLKKASYDSQFKVIKDTIRSIQPNIPVYKSTLYTSSPKVEKVIKDQVTSKN